MAAYVDDLFDPVLDQGPPVSDIQESFITTLVFTDSSPSKKAT